MEPRHPFKPSSTDPNRCGHEDQPGVRCGLVASNSNIHAPGAVPPQARRRPSLAYPVPMARLDAPETSHEAALNHRQRAARFRTLLLQLIEMTPGCTDDDLEIVVERQERRRTGHDRSMHGVVSGATNALRTRRLVEYVRDDNGRAVTKPIRSGNRGRTMQITEAGREFLDEHGESAA